MLPLKQRKLTKSLVSYREISRISVRKINNVVFHHLPIFLCYVILNHGRSREISFLRERKALQREKRALTSSIHSWKSCKGCNRDLPKASSPMTALSRYASYIRGTIERVFTDSGYSLVVMMEPTHYRNSDQLVPCMMRGKSQSARFRDLLLNPLMCA